MNQLEPQTARANRHPPRDRILRADEAELWRRHEAIIEDAQRTADRLRSEAGDLYDREKRRGFQEGWCAGAEEAARLVVDTKMRTAAYLASVEGQLAELAIEIVEQMLGSLDSSDVLVKAVQHALTRLRQDQTVVLKVAPSRVDDVHRRLTHELSDDARRRLVAVEADPQLGPDACVLSSDLGFIDIGVEAQLNILRRRLMARDEGG